MHPRADFRLVHRRTVRPPARDVGAEIPKETWAGRPRPSSRCWLGPRPPGATGEILKMQDGGPVVTTHAGRNIMTAPELGTALSDGLFCAHSHRDRLAGHHLRSSFSCGNKLTEQIRRDRQKRPASWISAGGKGVAWLVLGKAKPNLNAEEGQGAGKREKGLNQRTKRWQGAAGGSWGLWRSRERLLTSPQHYSPHGERREGKLESGEEKGGGGWGGCAKGPLSAAQ